MICDKQYVKALLQKQVKDTATPSETALLLLAFDLYCKEEITGMYAQIDLSVNEDELHRRWPPPSVEEIKQWLQQKKNAEAEKRRR